LQASDVDELTRVLQASSLVLFIFNKIVSLKALEEDLSRIALLTSSHFFRRPVTLDECLSRRTAILWT
jgi:hypothetical protein